MNPPLLQFFAKHGVGRASRLRLFLLALLASLSSALAQTAIPTISPNNATGIQNQPFFYQIQVSNLTSSAPITAYAVDGLALIGGLSVDPATGAISGTPTNAGTFTVVLSATNTLGTGSVQITIVIDPESTPTIRLTGNVPGSGGAAAPIYKLLGNVPWSASVTSVNASSRQPYVWIAYVVGADIYGNTIHIQVGRGTVPVLQRDQTFEIAPGDWIVPNDGTLFNTEAGYSFVVSLYEAAPTTLEELQAPFLSLTGRLKIDVIPNLAVPSPAVIYPGPDQKQFFKGGDIAQFESYWFNRPRGEATENGRVQSRPLRSRDRYSVALRLSSNPAFRIPAGTNNVTVTVPEEDDQLPGATDEVNDDFKLMNIFLAADLGPGVTPDGYSQIRRVEVTDTPPGTSAYPTTPGALNPYGIPLAGGVGTIPDTPRDYEPQPYDGFLDIGEQVAMVSEQLMPDNFIGSFYVAARVAMNNPDLDAAPGNNVFVSNGAPRIQLVEKESPILQPASAISSDQGIFIDGGYNASDNSSVSETGEFVAFESTANNLLVPPDKASVFVGANGGGKDMADPANYPAIFGGVTVAYLEILPFLTTGRQIFLKYRQTGEVVLVSRDIAGVQANADTFNPSVSADGRYVAYDSRASNILPINTGGRSAIYVFDTQSLETVVVSRNANLTNFVANGDSFRPQLSATGRFVVFESLANNLDPARPLPGNSPQQIYLHDRDTDADGDFDEDGNVATYLVSVTDDPGTEEAFNGYCARGVVNIDDSSAALASSGGKMFVAFTSYAGNVVPNNAGYSMVYRAAVQVTGSSRGAIPAELSAVSLTSSGAPPQAVGEDPMGAFIRPDSDDATINGNGSVIAFTSSGTDLVPDDSNQVPDVFVRDFNRPISGGESVLRVSVADERVATGVISFISGPAPANVPDSQPLPGDSITISDGTTSLTFEFDLDVPIGANVQETRNNLIAAINASFAGTLVAQPTTPPNVVDNTGAPDPGLGYNASIYIKNTTPGDFGNVPITVSLVADPTRLSEIVAEGMRGGGRQANDDALAPGEPFLPPILGVPLGSGQPSIDRTGNLVAFRTLATDLDVYAATDDNIVPPLPPFPGASVQDTTLITGELIRPLIFPTANVYLHNRQVAAVEPADIPGNTRTTRVSVNNFGYPTLIFGTQPTGVNANTSAANHQPAISANGRYVSFSSDSTAEGGLVFRQNNLDWPLDQRNVRNVFVQDRRLVGENPAEPTTRPIVDLKWPVDGFRVPPGSTVALSATAFATIGKTIESVQFYVNGVAVGAPFTAEPYSTTYTVQNPGSYTVRVVARDSRGITKSDSATITAGEPLAGEAPLIALTQPATQVANYVVGSDLVFNANATDADGDVASVNFFVGGERIPGVRGFDGAWYAAYRPTRIGVFTFFATATDDDGNTGVTQVNTIGIYAVGNPSPSLEILDNNPGFPAVAGGIYPLRARITSPPSVNIGEEAFAAVLFYADGVYLGFGTLQEDGTYLLNWRVPQTPRSYARIYAYLSDPNDLLPTVDGDTGGDTAGPTSYANVVVRSSNFLTVTTLAADPLNVSLLRPSNNAQVAPGVPTLLEAAASAPAGQGTISRVEFYQNGELITLPTGGGTNAATGAVTASPYQINFTPPSPGRYTLVALAYSTAGVAGQSAAININAVSGSAPTVAITTPPNGLTTPQTALSVGWRATDPDGSVQKAELLVNGRVGIGSTGAALVVDRAVDPASNPGSNVLTYTPPSQGSYTFVVRVTDNLGNVTDSSPVTVTVNNSAANPLPLVSLTQPLGVSYVAVGSEFYAGASAQAASPKTISSVSFNLNGQLVNSPTKRYGSVYAAPFTITERKGFLFDTSTFNQLAVGGNELFAEAADSAGLLNASQVYRIASYGARNPLPTVTMLPLYGGSDTVSVGGTVILQARPNFPTAANQEPVVEFFANGVSIGLGTKNANNNDYSLEWSPAENGPFMITARAQAVNWTSSSVFDEVITGTKIVGSSISDNFITLNTAPGVAPTVSITSPSAGANLAVNTPVRISASAVVPSGGQGAIQKVEFYQNGILIGAPDTQSPFEVEFTPPSPGTYTLIAVAYGTSGLIGSSSTVQFNAVGGNPPTVAITTPSSNLAIPQVPLTLGWTASDTDGSVQSVQILVNGAPYQLFPGGSGVLVYTFPSQGSYVFVARATDNLGNVTDSSPRVVTVNNAAQNPLPTVTLLNQPIVDQRYVAGSQLYFNATAQPRGANTIASNGVSFALTTGSKVVPAARTSLTAGGRPVYAASYEINSTDFPDTSLYALAQDSATNVGTSSSALLRAANALNPFPTVQMLPLDPSAQGVAGGSLQLRAKADFPVLSGTTNTNSRVEFYADGAFVGIASPNTNPATVGLFTHFLNWTTPTNNSAVSYKLTARAVAKNATIQVLTTNFQVTTSNSSSTVISFEDLDFFASVISPEVVSVNVITNRPPGVFISRPSTNGAQVGVGVTNPITATVTNLAANASVREVQFYVDGIFQTNDTSFPYIYNFAPSNTGQYSLAAVVVDNFGLQGSSSVRTVNAVAGLAPTVSIVSPTNGSVLSSGAPVTLFANASDPDGNVVSVTFRVNGVAYPATAAAGAWTAQFTPSSPGSYRVVAIATDNSGNEAYSAESVFTVPTATGLTVTLASPGAGEAYTLGTPVIFNANATVTTGTVASVQFYVNNLPVGSPITSAPYTYAYSPPTTGNYSVYALAIDSAGNIAISAPRSFFVGDAPASGVPSLFLSAPQNPFITQGSRAYLNYTAVLPSGGPVPAENVRIYINGVLQSGVQKIGPSGDTFSVLWNVGVSTNYIAYATISDAFGTTGFSGITTFTTAPQGKPRPIVEILPFQSANPFLSVGVPLSLRARANFLNNANPTLEFYANGVYVGPGVAGTTTNSWTTYSLDWAPNIPTAASYFTGSISGSTMSVTSITAGSAGLAVGMLVTGDGISPNTIITALGSGTTGGPGTYTVNTPQTVASRSLAAFGTVALTARASGENATAPTSGGGAGSTNSTTPVLASVISANAVIPPVTNLPIYDVPAPDAALKQQNGQFVVWMFSELLYRPPTYPEYLQYLAMLGGSPTASASVDQKAEVVMRIMGFDSSKALFNPESEYSKSSAVAFAPYGRLPGTTQWPLVPTRDGIVNFINLMESDASLLPLSGTYAGFAGAPWRATYGMARAMQTGIFDTVAFNNAYPTARGLFGMDFVVWMTGNISPARTAFMFPGRPDGGNARVDLANMIDDTPTLVSVDALGIRQGAGAAFQSEFVNTMLWSGLAGTDPNGVEKNFQLKLNSAALSFQLSGSWNFATASLYSKPVVEAALITAGYAVPRSTSGSPAIPGGGSTTPTVSGGSGPTVSASAPSRKKTPKRKPPRNRARR